MGFYILLDEDKYYNGIGEHAIAAAVNEGSSFPFELVNSPTVPGLRRFI